MNKQTALQWLIGYYYDNEGAIGIKQLEQAQQMEKENIMYAFDDGDYNYHYNRKNGTDFENGEDYFNEVYGGKDEN
jgi:hypothetical protein